MTTMDGRTAPMSFMGLAQGWLGHAAIACIYMFAFLSPLSITLGQLAQFGMLIITLVVVARNWQGVIRSPVFWIAVAFVVYVLLRGLSAAFFEQLELSSSHLEGTGT